MCCGNSCGTCPQPTSWDGAILKGELSSQVVFKIPSLEKQTNRPLTYWIWVTEKLFQYVCDNEQMLSLFGCRVSNVLEFELRNMLKNFPGHFLCTFFLDNLLCTNSSCSRLRYIVTPWGYGHWSLFRLDGRFLFKENLSSLRLNIHLMATLHLAGNSLHNLPRDKRSSSSRLIP